MKHHPIPIILALMSLATGTGAVTCAQNSGGETSSPSIIHEPTGSLGVASNTHEIAPSGLWPGTMPVSLTQLDNMEYHTDHGNCRLTNGVYSSQFEALEGYWRLDWEVMRGTYISGIHKVDHADHAMGDLNNDGLQDAVVILRESGGGTGVYISLAVVVNEKGTLRNTATVYMGDRQEITSLIIGAGMISVSGFTHRPAEGYMQPTLPALWIFRVQGKAVELISGPKAKSPDEYGKEFEKLMNEKQPETSSAVICSKDTPYNQPIQFNSCRQLHFLVK